jgi:hypothetical protein
MTQPHHEWVEGEAVPVVHSQRSERMEGKECSWYVLACQAALFRLNNRSIHLDFQ